MESEINQIIKDQALSNIIIVSLYFLDLSFCGHRSCNSGQYPVKEQRANSFLASPCIIEENIPQNPLSSLWGIIESHAWVSYWQSTLWLIECNHLAHCLEHIGSVSKEEEEWLLRILHDLLRALLGFEILQSMPSSHGLFSFSLRRESICLQTAQESAEGFQGLFLPSSYHFWKRSRESVSSL